MVLVKYGASDPSSAEALHDLQKQVVLIHFVQSGAYLDQLGSEITER